MGILVPGQPRLGIKHVPPAIEARNLNHSTTREIPIRYWHLNATRRGRIVFISKKVCSSAQRAKGSLVGSPHPLLCTFPFLICKCKATKVQIVLQMTSFSLLVHNVCISEMKVFQPKRVAPASFYPLLSAHSARSCSLGLLGATPDLSQEPEIPPRMVRLVPPLCWTWTSCWLPVSPIF